MLVEQEVKEALEEVRPHLQADGGDLDFVGIEDNVVKVRLKGSCAGCPMSQMTIKWGVENYLKKKIPEIEAVEAV
jgi:Fe-S cluster biogenesis protein NfuA